ncbi:GH19623 [Drosophila grimshawi]|uniref:GH19623 n=1 Tax=Drosophila grimshawi TaxID=7222 RepID=B4K3W4_DROGR|nr:GH19623 [Drosophila grimshawi]
METVGNDAVAGVVASTAALHLHAKSHDELPQSPRLPMASRHSSPMSSRQGSLRRRNKSAPRNSYEDYEERAIPTLRHVSNSCSQNPHRPTVR